MPDPKETICITFEINENTGKLVGAKGHSGGKKDKGPDEKDVTDSIEFKITKSSPACVWYRINGVWYKFCS